MQNNFRHVECMHPYILCFIVDIHSTCLKLFYIRSYINYFDCCFCMTFSLSALEICFFFHACWNAFSSIVSTILTMLPLFWSFLNLLIIFVSSSLPLIFFTCSHLPFCYGFALTSTFLAFQISFLFLLTLIIHS